MSSSPSLLHLPNEILLTICRHLPNRDIKSLRQSCSRLCAGAPLRLDRVFLSANPRNVAVFKAVAAHEVFRHQVTEIVWDDALLVEDSPANGDNSTPVIKNEAFYNGPAEDEDDWDPAQRRPFPWWFGDACGYELLETIEADSVHTEMASWTKRPILPISECWVHYEQLLQQQREVQESMAHMIALENAWGQRRFPAVRTITITPAAHGRLFYPLYETPMIRALPPGFVYPLPRGWPVSEEYIQEAEKWKDRGSDWYGFRMVTSIVAEFPYDLAELRVDSFQLQTGLNVRVFEKRCRALKDFTKIVTRPSFRHLHLDLLVGGQKDHNWAAFTRGHLGRVLSKAKLESLSIRTDLDAPSKAGSSEYRVPLKTLFQPGSLSHLRHFSLSGFHVREDELLEVLADLQPGLIQTVELSSIAVVKEDDDTLGDEDDDPHVSNLRQLLERMRDELSWQNVKVTFGDDCPELLSGRAIWVDLDDFLYRGGENPFAECPGTITPGFGVVRDLFDLSFERPYLAHEEMKARGYHDFSKEMEAIQCRR